jgi:hypothetical protein
MKRLILFAAIGFALAVSTVNAQPITGTPFLSNVDPNGANITYANAWTSLNYTFTQTPTGLELSGPGGGGSFGQLTYTLPANQLTTPNAADIFLNFSYTLNSGTPLGGIQEVLGLTDSGNATDYYFSGYVTPHLGVNAFSVPIVQGNLGDIQAGDPITKVNLQLDPANMSGNFDLTFNTIALSTVPEPATLGIGMMSVGLLALRRRRNAKA